MRVVIFGATGMIGRGVLRECLLAPDVEQVVTLGRRQGEETHEKLEQLVIDDLTDYSSVQGKLAGVDACFFCLGVTSAGMSEADYRKVTCDIVVAAGKALAAASPQATFVFVSGLGADAKSTRMWSRVKGEAENAVLAMPFKRTFVFRPAFILAHARHHLADHLVPHPLRRRLAAFPAHPRHRAEARHHHRARGASDAQGGAERVREARAGEPGHRRRRRVAGAMPRGSAASGRGRSWTTQRGGMRKVAPIADLLAR